MDFRSLVLWQGNELAPDLDAPEEVKGHFDPTASRVGRKQIRHLIDGLIGERFTKSKAIRQLNSLDLVPFYLTLTLIRWFPRQFIELQRWLADFLGRLSLVNTDCLLQMLFGRAFIKREPWLTILEAIFQKSSLIGWFELGWVVIYHTSTWSQLLLIEFFVDLWNINTDWIIRKSDWAPRGVHVSGKSSCT